MSTEVNDSMRGVVRKIPPWARNVDSKLYWMVTSESYRGEYSPDDTIRLLVLYRGDQPPTSSPSECKWNKINSVAWTVSCPINKIPELAVIPGIDKITI